MKNLILVLLVLLSACSVEQKPFVEPDKEYVVKPAWIDVDMSYLMGSWKVKETLKNGSLPPNNKFFYVTNLAFSKDGRVVITFYSPADKKSTNQNWYWQYIKRYSNGEYIEPRLIIGDSFLIGNDKDSPAHIGLKQLSNKYTLIFQSAYILIGTERNDVIFYLSK